MNDPKYVLKRMGPRPQDLDDADDEFGVFMVGHTVRGSMDDWGQCLGVVFTDPVEREQHPDTPYTVWVKWMDANGDMRWRAREFAYCSKEQVPEMTQWLYNWALLGGYKDTP